MSANLGELQAFTHEHAERYITDNVYHRHVALMAFKKKEQTYPGGLYIREGLEISDDPKSVTGKALEKTGTYDIVELETYDAAQFRPRYYVQTIPLWDADVADNGASDVHYWEFVKNRQASCMRIMQARFARHLYSRGNNSLQINGLGDIFDNSTPFGRISRQQHSFWRSRVHTRGNQPINTTSVAKLVADISDGDMEPDVMFTSTDVSVQLEALLTDRQRYPNNAELASFGFRHINYQGAIPIVSDKYCDVNTTTQHKLYALNFDHIRWRPHRMYNMKHYDWLRMPKNLGQFALIVWFGNITCNQMRRQGALEHINVTNVV